MPKNITLSVIGGDDRQFYIADFLKKAGFCVKTYGISNHMCEQEKDLYSVLSEADIAVLPLPVSRDEYHINASEKIPFESFVSALPKNCRVFAGKLPPSFKDCLNEKGVSHFDYYEDSYFVWKNADISAEGAVSLLMQSLLKTVRDSEILICGYGRIGKCLAQKLTSLGASVTVAARKENDIMLASLNGCQTDRIDYTRKGIFDTTAKYDAVINTVPSWLFDRENLDFLKNCVYIELASAPFGGKAELLKEICDYKGASGIPGKYAPLSAAKSVFEALIKYIEAEEFF